MGIRFLCPNGHKLHVKTFLAGKRAICPECDAKVIVPGGGEAVPTEPNTPADQPPPEEHVEPPVVDAPSLSRRHAKACTPTTPIAKPQAAGAAAVPEPILPDAPPTASIVHRTKIKRQQKRQVQVALLLSVIVVVMLVALVAVVFR